MFDALVGLERRYIFENGGFVFAKVSYENKLYNSHKEVFMRVGVEALRYENENYDNVINANLGARVLNIGSWKLDIEGIYRHYNNGLEFLCGNLSVKKVSNDKEGECRAELSWFSLSNHSLLKRR